MLFIIPFALAVIGAFLYLLSFIRSRQKKKYGNLQQIGKFMFEVVYRLFLTLACCSFIAMMLHHTEFTEKTPYKTIYVDSVYPSNMYYQDTGSAYILVEKTKDLEQFRLNKSTTKVTKDKTGIPRVDYYRTKATLGTPWLFELHLDDNENHIYVPEFSEVE